jgi:glucan 1,3-beta-glucosidase
MRGSLALFIAILFICQGVVYSVKSRDLRYSSTSPYHKRASVHPRIGRQKTVRGVNLGGWFVLELWMMPDFFTDALVAKGATDQYHYMNTVSSAVSHSALTNHWKTWITETDFQQIAAAGLNTVRLPVPHWAFNGSSSEPYWAYAEQPYISQALLWAKQYNLDVIIDMHTAPQSQNGFDNSGRAGPSE